MLGFFCLHEDLKLEYKRVRFQEEKEDCQKFLSSQNPVVVMLQETKREIWDRRFKSSVWKGRSIEWATLPACGASRGIVIM